MPLLLLFNILIILKRAMNMIHIAINNKTKNILDLKEEVEKKT
jgi:hypothetical protein